jgi:uncharacterized membrane protein YdbT with pleckstrin-like domain
MVSWTGMSPEEQLWEGAPSLKVLSFDVAWTLVFSLGFALVVYLGYDPALRAISGLSKDAARAVAAGESGLRLGAIVFVAVVVGSRLVRLVSRALALRSQRYRLSNQRLLVERGVLSRTIDEIDLRTVEDITFHQSLGERLFGLGQIGIVSSEPAGQGFQGMQGFGRRGQLRARLVAVPDARAVREQIRNAAYAASGKQIFMRPT